MGWAEGAEEVEDKDELRFEIGQAVEANTGEAWVGGVVVALNYREDEWPEGRTAPYQIELSDGRLIFAPYDDDSIVRARATEVKGKGKGEGKEKGKQGQSTNKQKA